MRGIGGRGGRRAAAAATAGLAAATGITSRGETPRSHPLPPPGDEAWEVLELPGVERPSRYTVADEEGRPVLEASADCGGSALAVAVPGVELAATPILRWRWWARELPDEIEELVLEGDDFAARVSVMFAFEPERASWVERVRHDLVGLVVGREMPASALHFLWTAEVAPGTVWDNPRTTRAKNWALERGPAEGWRDAEIDVARAYRLAFGREAPPLLAVGVMTDGDDHCGSVEGRYADFRFGPRGADREDFPGIEAPAPPDAD